MKTWLLTLACLTLASIAYAAGEPKLSKETLADIAKHEKMAAAHAQAARCLREGKPDEVCEGALLAACKGIAIGRFCGMKH